MIDIDFVIPWVDGADPVWADSYRQYAHLEDKRFNVSGERFRDWGLLRFWFRAVAKYAPWVRTIHFVSCGQVPTWLNKEHPQLHLVKHEDYLPARFLPTFCANPIELSFHRIEGLSEHFVYFNDDMFLSAPVQPSDFFKNGLPRETAIRSHLLPSEFGHIVLNDINLINKYLDFYSLYRKNLRKWFNARYGLQGLKNFLFIPYKDFTGMRESHLPYTLRKSTFEAVWQKCGKELEVKEGSVREGCVRIEYPFDYFSEMSHPDYRGISDEQYENRMLLQDMMIKGGDAAKRPSIETRSLPRTALSAI